MTKGNSDDSHLVLAGIFAFSEPHDRLPAEDGHHKVGPAFATIPLTHTRILEIKYRGFVL